VELLHKFRWPGINVSFYEVDFACALFEGNIIDPIYAITPHQFITKGLLVIRIDVSIGFIKNTPIGGAMYEWKICYDTMNQPLGRNELRDLLLKTSNLSTQDSIDVLSEQSERQISLRQISTDELAYAVDQAFSSRE
jgi:hypothetical protein